MQDKFDQAKASAEAAAKAHSDVGLVGRGLAKTGSAIADNPIATGAALGGVTGAALGHAATNDNKKNESEDEIDEGAIEGAIVGGASGAIIGDQVERSLSSGKENEASESEDEMMLAEEFFG